MKKQNDPRKTLTILSRISLLVFFLIPFIYFAIKSGKMLNIVIIIVGILLLIYFQIKKIEDISYATFLGYFFSGIWVFIASIFIGVSIRRDLPIFYIYFIFLLIIFSIILLYLSEKSLSYEKTKLRLKRKFNPRNVFILFLLLSLLRIILSYV